MRKAYAWWNGFITVVGLAFIWYFLAAIWQHNKSDIVSYAFFVFVCLCAWLGTAIGASE